MGYRRIPRIITLDEFEEYPGLIVRMRGLSFGKMRRIMTMLDAEEEDSGKTTSDVVDEVAKHLVSWNLEDEDGAPIAADADGLDSMDLDFVLSLINAWLDQVTGPDKDLGKGSASGGAFPGQPLTMEAL